MVINTPLGRESFYDEKSHPAGRDSIQYSLHYDAIGRERRRIGGIRALIEDSFDVQPLQSLHAKKAAAQKIALLGD